MGYFTVKKEFTNEDKGQKTKYQVSDVKIMDTKFSKSRLAKWEKLGWIEWTR